MEGYCWLIQLLVVVDVAVWFEAEICGWQIIFSIHYSNLNST